MRMYRTIAIYAAAILAGSVANADFATLPAALAKDIASADVKARVRARQLMPRHGVAAIDPLLPLLAGQDQGAKLTAYNVLADVANMLAGPGFEQERRIAAEKLMTLVGVEQPEAVKLQGLRLLPIVVPEGFDVSPVAALLSSNDANLREKARESLGLMATNEACDALVSAAASADAPFAVALLDAVAMLRNARALDPTASLLAHTDPRVRNAAARAVAWSGEPRFMAPLETVVKQAPADQQTEAYDALLRLADAMARRGGNWDTAMAVYKSVLSAPAPATIRAAAMMGLGRYGDGSVVDEIVAAAAAAQGALDATAAMALTSLQGGEGVAGALAAYPKLAPSTRLQMLAVWGQQRQEQTLDLLKQELAGTDPVFRGAALHAMAAIGSMKSFPDLVHVAKHGNNEERAFALDAVKRMAGNLGSTGDKQAAGLAYVQVYSLSEDEALRADALRGIAQNPVPQAYDAVRAALEQPNLKPLAIDALAAVAGALSAGNEPAKAVEAAKLVQSAGAPTETLVRMVAAMGASAPPELAGLLGVVRSWNVIGPFEWKSDAAWNLAFVGEPNVDVAKPVQAAGKTLAWKPVQAGGPIGLVDLMGAVGPAERSFAYAYAEVDMPEEAKGQIRIGSDDGNQIWLNGKKVFENRVDRGSAMDQDKVDVLFAKGRNILLVKISQGAGGWNFCLRLTHPDGSGLSFSQP